MANQPSLLRQPNNAPRNPRLPTGSRPDTPAPPPGRILTGYFRRRPPYYAQRHLGTRDWLLTFTLRGQGDYRQPELTLTARPGDLVLLEPGAHHHYGCLQSRYWEFLWAHFVPRPHWLTWLKYPLEGHGLRRFHLSDLRVRRRVRQAFQRSHLDAQKGSGFGEELAMNGLEEVLMLSAREQAWSLGEARLSAGVRRAMEHLAEHLDQPQQVAELAQRAGLSASRFAHRFKEETGDSVISYLNKLRLQRGARLLAFSGRSVKEISADVGFESPFYFSRMFKRQYGVSPICYAQSARS